MSEYESLALKRYYFSPEDNIPCSFFIPVLERSMKYDRAAGFFTSSSLVEISVGVYSLAKRGGKIRIITSPRLTKEDIVAIKSGYDLLEICSNSMVNNFDMPKDKESLDRLSFLSKLVATGTLEFKVAITKNLDQYPNSMFHAKFGIIYNDNGDMISFSGSMNASANGIGGNWDHIHVSSYNEYPQDVLELKDKFEELWNGKNTNIFTMDFPKVAQDLIKSFHVESGEINLDQELLRKYTKTDSIYFRSPDWLEIRPYQQSAIFSWFDHENVGIFNMATGTGKTKTALCALERLYNEHPDDPIYTVIVAPQKHLVDQWAEEVKTFNVVPIVGHSESNSNDWKADFRRSVMLFKNKPKNSCLVTTISSFSSKEVQEWLLKIKNLAIVVDEAHNMGSYNRLRKLPEHAKYRLALSATVERYKDEFGTIQLKRYFGEECINLPIEEAIGKYLTNYKYYPIMCVYNENEYSQFIQSNETLDVILASSVSKADKQAAKNEFALRSYTLNAKVQSKFDNLCNLLKNHLNDDHMLIYCGKTRMDDEGNCDAESQSEGIKVIDKTSQLVGINGLGFKVSKVTYKESLKERREIFNNFETGRVAGIVAISCLDEGVDIPSIRSAYILTSSDNPREYIQRRGRVLRKCAGKEFAEIYDFVVIPRKLSDVSYTNFHAQLELRMLAKEIRRMVEFSRISLNPLDSEEIFSEISNAYHTTIEEILDTYGEKNND